MKADSRLFPELARGASLRWYIYQLGDGSISRDPARAIAARKAGEFVRLIPQHIGAAHLLHRDQEPELRA